MPSATISTVGGNVARLTRETDAILAARRQRLKRLASVDVLSGSIGAIICTAFVLSMYVSPEGGPQIPKHQIAGMIFTCLLCPLVYFGYREFYLQNRVLLVFLVRLVFAFGTVHDYADTPHDSLTWPSFLISLVYYSRALVMAWGCFGWQLRFPIHAAVQAAHVAAASQLITPLCAAPTSLTDPTAQTLMSENIGKFRNVMAVLDWPFAVLWPPAPRELSAATSDVAACTAVIFWSQAVLGWLIPTALLVASLSLRGRWDRTVQEHGAVVTGAIAQALWCITRVVVPKFV